jgi:hypothetical protein
MTKMLTTFLIQKTECDMERAKIKNKDIEIYKDNIFSITKSIIKDNFSNVFPFFVMEWDSLWEQICKLKETNFKDWDILYQTKSPFLFSLSHMEIIGYRSVACTVVAAFDFLIGSESNPGIQGIKNFVISFGKQHNIPDSVLQDILSLIVKTREVSIIPYSENIPVIEKEERKKDNIIPLLKPSQPKEEENKQKPSHLPGSEKGAPLLPPIKEEKKEYAIYSYEYPLDKFPEGEKITKAEYSLILRDLEFQRDDYLIQINEKKNEFLIWGEEQKVPEPSLITLKILIRNVDSLVNYEEIFKKASHIARNNDEFYGDCRDNVQGYILELHKNTNRRLTEFIINTRGKGYSLILNGKYKYCLIEII